MKEMQESETGMKKKKWAVRVLVALGLGMAVALAKGTLGEMQGKRTPEETVKLVLANNQPEDNCTTAAVEWFAGQVRERTDGRVEISVYNDGELGDVMSSLEQLQYGAVDIVKADVSAMSNYVGEYHAFLMPYIYQDNAHFWKVHSGEIGMGILRGK